MPIEEIIDDDTVPHSATLWRRIFPEDIYFDSNINRRRATSGSLRDVEGAVSVDLAMLTTLDEAKARGPGMAIAEFTAGVVRAVGCKVVKDPQPDNPAHTLIYGKHKNGGPTQGQVKKIAEKSEIISDP